MKKANLNLDSKTFSVLWVWTEQDLEYYFWTILFRFPLLCGNWSSWRHQQLSKPIAAPGGTIINQASRMQYLDFWSSVVRRISSLRIEIKTCNVSMKIMILAAQKDWTINNSCSVILIAVCEYLENAEQINNNYYISFYLLLFNNRLTHSLVSSILVETHELLV